MYLDPGFGGMLLQAIVGIVAVGGAIMFSFRKKIKSMFKKNTKKENKETSSNIKLADLKEDAIDMLDNE